MGVDWNGWEGMGVYVSRWRCMGLSRSRWEWTAFGGIWWEWLEARLGRTHSLISNFLFPLCSNIIFAV